ncbi:uncharacterized protein LOC119384100 [Rhipicephalus sanguineus]|uniref:uncharacterized protein LOC119384100 n=1 Tax=Rhipicephalus sanguineus TaxID=34632 RepID=UPI0020C59D4C|nr:uncharacterized protein LOC119384100 [Rhipicephalus sanguineus]
MVKAYPAALEDRSINGSLLGRGYDSLFQQLEARVENIHRGKRGIPSSTPVSTQKSAKMSYGCMNWQPRPVLHTDELDEKQQFLQREARKSPKDMDLSLAMVYMEDTYGAQRQFINSGSPVHHATEIKREWPLLFHRPFFYKHVAQLLGKDAKDGFQASLRGYAPLLFKHMKSVVKRDVIEWVIETEREVSKGCKNAKEVAFVPLLAAYFGDKEEALFKVFEHGTSITEVVSELPPTPIVAALAAAIRTLYRTITWTSLPDDDDDVCCLFPLEYFGAGD